MSHDGSRRVLVAAVAGLLTVPAILAAQSSVPNLPDEGAISHVRVVRLSYVSGSVSFRRPESNVWEKALVDTPLQEGFELATGEDSFAEVEF